MGAKHTRAKSGQPATRPEAVQCPTQSSDADGTTALGTQDSRMYHIRKAGARNPSVSGISLAEKHHTTSCNLVLPQPLGINVSKVSRHGQRPSLPDLVFSKKGSKASPYPFETPAQNSFLPRKTRERVAKSEFTSPTHMLLKRHLQHESPTCFEFEVEEATPAFVQSLKETQRSYPPQSTYKLIKPKKYSETTESEHATPNRGIMSLLREAATVKYEAQKKGSSRNITELLSGPSALTSPKSGSLLATFPSREESVPKYKIKSLLNLNLVNAHAEKEEEKKRRVRVWKGRRGTILVPSEA